MRFVCLLSLCLGCTLIPQLAVGQGELKRVTYNHPGLTVDLGVGLWAWPMPMDYDQDGDPDLVVTCPDKPYNGTYFFENPGGSDFPVFLPGRRIGGGHQNIQVSYVDGEPRVLIPGTEFVHFRQHQLDRPQSLGLPKNVHTPGKKIRANQWKLVDYNGDGLQDVVIGVGDWSDYGWDDAYDSRGNWTNGPLRGFVYVALNTGTADQPAYAKPQRLTVPDGDLQTFGWPSPNFADLDGDGDLDLLCGEFLDRFTYFENIGRREAPQYAAGRRIPTGEGDLRMDLQMIVPVLFDWDGDGDQDIICGDEDGRVALIRNTGRLQDRVPVFAQPRYFRQQADEVKFGALVTPFSFDWDGDGDEDLICGNTAGYVGLFENLDGRPQPRWAAVRYLEAGGKPIRIQAGSNGSIQGPCEAKWGYTTLNVADWDHDGRADLIVNSIWGSVEWYRNVGTTAEPKLEPARTVKMAWKGTPPKPEWVWWQPQPDQLVTQWRTTPVVYDWNADGLHDLVMLDHEGFLAFFERFRDESGNLRLRPGQRVFSDASGKPLRLNAGRAGRSGRRKLHLVDWNQDGRIDLLANSVNADLYVNRNQQGVRAAFENLGPIDDRNVSGHTSSPTVCDWNRDGLPDLLVGAEDGRLYHRLHPRTKAAADQDKP